MKKSLAALYIAGTLVTCTPHPIKATDPRQTALVVIGSLLAAGGVYTLCKDNENKGVSNRIGRVIASFGLIGLGTTTILLSKQARIEIDRITGNTSLKEQLKQASEKAAEKLGL